MIISQSWVKRGMSREEALVPYLHCRAFGEDGEQGEGVPVILFFIILLLLFIKEG